MIKRNFTLTAFLMLILVCFPVLAEDADTADDVSAEAVEQAEESRPYEQDDVYYQLELFSKALSYVLHNYYNDNREFTPEDLEKVTGGAIGGMLQGLGDRYSFYQPEERRKREQENLFHAKFGGLGIRILPSPDGFVRIVQPLDGTPAMKVGLRSGDKIIEIEGESIQNKALEEVVDVLRGEVGTDVTVTIFRPGRDKPFPVTITRGIIDYPSMTNIMIEDHIGYVRIFPSFTKETPKELETVLTKFKEQGMRGLIIDLRGNTGGLMSSAMEVADAFLKEGIIVSTEGRIERSDAEYRADEDLLCPMDMPLAILVNGSSASGSEIVAGAIKDHKRGIIVGEKTFGKALVQQRFPLDDYKRETGPAISITISIYKTPNGDWIHGKGIEPNVEVEQPDLFEGEDDEVAVKLYEGEYIDKLVYDYVDKHKDQTTEEQIRALEEKIPELMKTLSDDGIELSERIIRWYVRSTFARVKYIPNVDLENDPQLAAAIEEIKKQLLDQGSS